MRLTRGANGSDLQSLAGIAGLRRRYLGLGLILGVSFHLLAALEPGAAAWLVVTRLAMAVFSAACWFWLRRGGSDGLALAKVVLSVELVVLLWVAKAQMPATGWPIQLTMLPLICFCATLLAGFRLGATLSAISLGVTLLFFLLPGAPRPPYLASNLVNLGLALLFLQLFARQLANLLRSGAADLAASSEALREAQRATTALSATLSEQVARAAAELEEALKGNPERQSTAVRRVATLLEESRRAVPAAPELPDAGLSERIDKLRQRATDYSLYVLFGLLVLVVVRTLVIGPPKILVLLAINAGLALTALLLRLTYPAWNLRLLLGLHVAVVFGTGPVVLWSWFSGAPAAPPAFLLLVVGAASATATVGLWLGLLELVAIVAVSMLALHFHPGIPWTGPVILALFCAFVCVMLWRMPRDLLGELNERRDEAAGEIRRVQRLFATLFHDLANPFQVIQFYLEEMAIGEAEPGDLERAQEMAARMTKIVASAIENRADVHVVEAGSLFDALERLFRDRLTAKKVALHVSGPRTARLRGDPTLLRESVLGNLLSNALKFSPPGSTIEVAVRPEPGRVVLLVQDRGPGLPDDVRESVGRGERARSSRGTGGEQGTGYGLLLAKEHLASMGGTLELCNREGGGLEVRVRLAAA